MRWKLGRKYRSLTIFNVLINNLKNFSSFLGWRHLQPNHHQALPGSWRCPRWYARRYAPRCWRYARCRCTPRCRIRTHCRRGRLICSLLDNKPHQQPEVSWFFLQNRKCWLIYSLLIINFSSLWWTNYYVKAFIKNKVIF